MRWWIVVVGLAWSSVAAADECTDRHARLDDGRWQQVRREVLLVNETPEDACTHALWARLYERDLERLRAAVFWLRAGELAAEGQPLSPRWVRRATRQTATPAVRRALVAMKARDPIPMPTPRALADATCLRAIGYAPRCTVVRRLGSVVVLREISGVFHETDTFWIAQRVSAGWKLVTSVDQVGNGRGVVGSHELRALRLAQVIPGGSQELDITVHADVGEMTACGTERHAEERRTICRDVDGEWVCRSWTVRADAMRWEPHAEVERGCGAPPAVAGWSVALELSGDTVEVRTRSGAPPESAQVGRHALDEIFRR